MQQEPTQPPLVHQQRRVPWWVVPAAAAVHLALVLALLFLTAALSSFGNPSQPSLPFRLFNRAFQLLNLPMVTPLLLGWVRLDLPWGAVLLVSLANSLCWGTAVWLLASRWREHRAA